MFNSIGNLLHKTPWWALLLAGVTTFVLLVLFALPVQVIHLVDSANTRAERSAIQHEVGQAVTDRFLDVAQGVVSAAKEKSTDPGRLRELDRALSEIARSREELARAPADSDAFALDRAREAGEQAMEAAIETAEAALEAATDARDAVQEARADAMELLRDKDLDIASTRQSFDQLLDAARAKEAAARESLAAVRSTQPDLSMAPAAPPAAWQGSGASATVKLSPERKYAIHTQVDGDMLQAVLGSALVLTFIPLFLLLLVVKFLLGRSRQALARAHAQTLLHAEALTVAAARPKGWRRLWHATSTTHGMWAHLLARTFIVLAMVLLGALLAGLLALAAGWVPVMVGDLQLDGMESFAVGSAGLLVGFGACALALAIVLAVVYGLGFLFAALMVFIPTVILLALLPVLAPFVLMVLGMWWLVTRNRRV